MNIIRKYKISKLLNKPLDGIEGDCISFIQNICADLIPFKYDKYPDSIFYMNSKGQWIFEQDNQNDRFYVRYNLVWIVLEKDYIMNNEDIIQFIKFMVEEAFKVKVSTIGIKKLTNNVSVEESFKNKVSTPMRRMAIYNHEVDEAFKTKISTPQSFESNHLDKLEDAFKKISNPVADDSNTINSSVEEAFQKVSLPTYGHENYTLKIEEEYKNGNK